jgi:hypothetical protein
MLAALYTHYTAIAGFAAHLAILGIIALAQRSRVLLTTLIAIVLLVGIGFAPWLPTLLTVAPLTAVTTWAILIPPDRSIAVMLGFKLLDPRGLRDSANTLVIATCCMMVLGTILSVRRWRAALTGIHDRGLARCHYSSACLL